MPEWMGTDGYLVFCAPIKITKIHQKARDLPGFLKEIVQSGLEERPFAAVLLRKIRFA